MKEQKENKSRLNGKKNENYFLFVCCQLFLLS